MLAPHSDHAIWRSSATPDTLFAYERVLGDALRPVVAELTLIDADVLVTCICGGKDAVLAELVDASGELAMTPHSLRYDRHAEVSFEWGRWPQITLGLAFEARAVAAHFNLVFGRRTIGIELSGVIFAEPLGSHGENVRRLVDALAENGLRPSH